MSFRIIGGDAAPLEDEELFEAASSVSGGESDGDDDRFPDGAGATTCEQDRRHRPLVPQPLRRMNSDSIYDMTSMMSQLPAKKGLSRYFEGKSQSFACMSEVRCLEDLRKKDNPYQRKMIKSCNSYAALGGVAKKPSSANLNLVAANGACNVNNNLDRECHRHQ